jgi:hypothetical protein
MDSASYYSDNSEYEEIAEAEGILEEVLAVADSIEDLYLGAKTEDPTVDNDGDELEVGAFYWNTTDEVLRFWTGTTWYTHGSVASFNGRSGSVVPVAGDYTAADITNVPAGTIAAVTVQAALAELDADIQLKANLASPALTGNPTAPTQTPGDNSTKIATTAYVDAAATGLSDDSVTDAILRDSVALSVIGRSANSTGNPGDIAASGDGEVLRRSGTTLGFGTIATAGIADDAVTYAKVQDVSATDKLLGRSTAGSGVIEEITCTAAGRALLDDAAASDQRTTLSAAARSQSDFISGIIKTGANSDFRIVERFPYAATITAFHAKTASGTITLTSKINSTAITTGAISVTSTQASVTPSAANVVAAADALVLTGSSNSSAVDISFTIEFTRTLS